MTDFDVVVIGSGPGGYIAALRAAELGLNTACVEKEDSLGGTCLNVGCIPSKALLQSSESYEWLKNSAKEQGINISDLSFDLTTMMQRKEGIVKGLVDAIASHFKKLKVTRLQGTACFLDPNTIEITQGANKKNYSSQNFIIATGSEPIALPFLPFDETRIVSSTGALNLKSVPKRLLVIGAGVIGVELASVYRRLGSQVSIVEMLEGITPAMDHAISRQLLQSLKKQGIEFYLGAKVTGASIGKSEISINVEHEQKALNMQADVVLVAVGRRPYSKGLDFEKAGIKTNPKGFIQVDANLRTTQPHIYAIGDVVEGPMLAHRASHEGMAAAELIAGKSPKINYISIPNVIYTHPEVAAVGLTETEAKQFGFDVAIGNSTFRGNGRARCSGETEGFVKVIGDKKSGRLLGMHIIGAHASELIAEGLIAMDLKATIKDIATACHAHPTLSEVIMEACQAAI